VSAATTIFPHSPAELISFWADLDAQLAVRAQLDRRRSRIRELSSLVSLAYSHGEPWEEVLLEVQTEARALRAVMAGRRGQTWRPIS